MKTLIIAICTLILAGCPPHDDAHPRNTESVGTVEQAIDSLETEAEFWANANVGFHQVTPDAIIVTANVADYESLGCTEWQWIGTDVRDHHVSQQKIDLWLATLTSGGEIRGDTALLWRCDGGQQCVRVWSSWSGFASRCITEVADGACQNQQ